MNFQTDIDLGQSLTFDNQFIRELPADTEAKNTRRQVMGACFSRVKPARVASPFQAAVDFFGQYFKDKSQAMMVQKLGFKTFEPATDRALIHDLSEILALVETDMSIFFRGLARVELKDPLNDKDDKAVSPLMEAYYVPSQLTPEYWKRFSAWMKRYRSRVDSDNSSVAARRKQMDSINPKYVLRNYLAQMAIDKAEQGDFSMIHELQDLVRHPYDEQPGKEEFAQKRPDWARSKPGCSKLSCSS